MNDGPWKFEVCTGLVNPVTKNGPIYEGQADSYSEAMTACLRAGVRIQKVPIAIMQPPQPRLFVGDIQVFIRLTRLSDDYEMLEWGNDFRTDEPAGE